MLQLGKLFWEGCQRILWERGTFSIITNLIYVLMAKCGLQPAKMIGDITPDFAAFFNNDREDFAKTFHHYFDSIEYIDEKEITFSINSYVFLPFEKDKKTQFKKGEEDFFVEKKCLLI